MDNARSECHRGAGVVLLRSLILVVLFLALAPARALADEVEPATADALFARAQREDDAERFADALVDYRATVARFPSSRYTPKAATRAGVLAAHAEGGFAPYARLEAVRRDPAKANDPSAIEALARDAATFPAGPTRGEAWMVCADAWQRLNRRPEAERAFAQVAHDTAADPLVRREAATLLVRALCADGDFSRARSEVGALPGVLDSKEARAVEALARRHWIHGACVTDVIVVPLLALFAIGRAATKGAWARVARAARGALPIALGFGVWVGAGGGYLASSYEAGNATPFLVFAAILAPWVLVARAWGVAGGDALVARAGRAVACVTAVVAAAFLVLEAVNPMYLDSFKL